jgi:cell division protein FtsW
MLVGIVLSFAGSPAVAERLGYDSFHFVTRHIAFAVPALAVMIATSFLSPQSARRVSLVVLGVMLVMMLATLFIGIDVKGARRWINFGELSIQPSEFMKPAFVVTVAWLFAENRRRQDIHGDIFAVILLVIVAALLIAEPDFGQTMLSLISWSLLFFMAGMSWFWIVLLIAVGFGGVFAAYTLLPHVAARIDKFISPASGDTFQVDKALDSILHGGWFGVGPGEGMVKRVLPDAHTDFIFAVGAEEFGIIACLVLVLTFALIVFRGLSRSTQTEDPFARLATAGLVVLFGVQSVINISVNLNLIPAKGMTLPFISYGGSSMIAMGFEIGLLLAFTRRRAEASRLALRLGFPTSASPGVA